MTNECTCQHCKPPSFNLLRAAVYHPRALLCSRVSYQGGTKAENFPSSAYLPLSLSLSLSFCSITIKATGGHLSQFHLIVRRFWSVAPPPLSSHDLLNILFYLLGKLSKSTVSVSSHLRKLSFPFRYRGNYRDQAGLIAGQFRSPSSFSFSAPCRKESPRDDLPSF